MANTPTRIVILGGGFGGLYTAQHLERQAPAGLVEVTLVSRENYFLMTPLLFEAGSGVLEPRHAVNPLRPMFRSTRFVEGLVTAVDLETRTVHLTQGPAALGGDTGDRQLPYDQLVVAVGGITNTKLITGSDRALPFKTLADAIAVRNHIIDTFERADAVDDPARRAALLTYVVMGAGLVGIELAGELSEFVQHLRRSYPRLQATPHQIVVVEAGPKVLAEMSRDMADYAVATLRKRGVEILVESPVAAIEPGVVRLAGGRQIPTATPLLAAGIAANPLLAALDLPKDPRGRLVVDAAMRSATHPEVWALGDCAAIPDPEGTPYPPLAQHAMREAKVLAANLLGVLAGRPTVPFVYSTKGTLASLGCYRGVGQIGPIKVYGFLAWWIWRTYYVMQMPRLERRLRVIIDWTVALFFKNDVVKLELR